LADDLFRDRIVRLGTFLGSGDAGSKAETELDCTGLSSMMEIRISEQGDVAVAGHTVRHDAEIFTAADA
jgi:hypothetical protein